MSAPRSAVLEDEWLIVRHSGELPEIALHSALYSLMNDPLGPQLQLTMEEIEYLQDAALARCQEIILRDLCYQNRNLTIYRGLQRAIFNWRRFLAFCQRQETAVYQFIESGTAQCRSLQGRIMSDRRATARALLHLLQQCGQPGQTDSLAVIFNCTLQDFTLFALELEIADNLSCLQLFTCSAANKNIEFNNINRAK